MISTENNSSFGQCLNLPFGDALACAGPQGGPLHFTGLERDTESNLDHTWFRQYSSAQGRWMSPDPDAGSMDPSNPQSLNRYAYVMNDPVNAVDPNGLDGFGLFQCTATIFSDCVMSWPLFGSSLAVFPWGIWANLGNLNINPGPMGLLTVKLSGLGFPTLSQTLQNLLAEFIPIDTCPAGTFECPAGGAPLFGQPGCYGPWCVNDSLGSVVPNVGLPKEGVPTLTGLCVPTPMFQMRSFGGCFFACEFVDEYPQIKKSPWENIGIGLAHFSSGSINAACGPGRSVPRQYSSRLRVG